MHQNWFFNFLNNFIHFDSIISLLIIFFFSLILNFFPFLFYFLFRFYFPKQQHLWFFFLLSKILLFSLLLKYFFDLYFPFLIFSSLQLFTFPANQSIMNILSRYFISVVYHAFFSNFQLHQKKVYQWRVYYLLQ